MKVVIDHFILLALGLLSLDTVVSNTVPPCDPDCSPPACSCPQFTYNYMATSDIPQMVYFGFDDSLNTVMSALYDQIFTDQRRNPNGCTMKMTLFVSHEYTDYTLVNHFYNRGHEIGVHSVSHSSIDTDQELLTEAADQKANLAQLAGVPADEIVGWRSPYLKPAGNNQPGILKDLGYLYDITYGYTLTTISADKPWPFTMDNGWVYNCNVPECPTEANVTDFWAVPVISLMDHEHRYPCPFVDGCSIIPANEEEAFKYLMDNFLSYYNTTRTPFGLNMHAAWFASPLYAYRLTAMQRFLDEIQSLNDVYVVTVKQMIDWMTNPTPLSNIHNFQSWSCDLSGQTQAPTPAPTAAPTNPTPAPTTPPPAPTTQAPATTTTPPMSLSCSQGTNCNLPSCFCHGVNTPNNLLLSEIPQLVYLTIDGTFSQYVYDRYVEMMYNKYNPNGCPVKGTLFVKGTPYLTGLLQDLVNNGAEIALQGTKDSYQSDQELHDDIVLQQNHMHNYNIPVTGWKSPGLKPYGNGQYDILQTLGLLYDATLSASGTAKQWPYTLDFGYDEPCGIQECPTANFPGLWEMPSNSIVDYLGQYPCVYADGCMFNPPTAADTENFLWDNLMQHYTSNKAPFALRLRQLWFTHPAYAANMQGVNDFIDRLATLNDVYLVSASDVITWMQDPVKVQDITATAPWNC